MAGEFAVINPRRHRRKKVRTRRKVSRRRRRRVAVNPIHRLRRRRHVARRRHNPRRHRRYARRHNPAVFGINIVKIGSIAGGFVGTEILAGYLSGMLPAAWKTDANLVRIGCKAAVGVGAPLLLKRFLPRGVANALAIGGGVAVLVDVFTTYIKPNIPGLPIGDYEQGYISDYEQSAQLAPGLSGSDSVYGESVY
jgi:hypothetical protein